MDNEDNRISCKYGEKCYQKNPAHHEKYKHPSKRKAESTPEHSSKKAKVEIEEVTTNKDLDSDDYSIQDDSDSNSEKYEKKNIKFNNDVSESDTESSKNNYSDDEENSNQTEVSSADSLESSSTPDKIETETKSENDEEDKNSEPDNSDNVTNTTSMTEEWSSYIKDKFLVTMPDDFYKFWEFCKKMNPNNPLEALREVGLHLVGPFDVLAGKFSGVEKTQSEYLIHWRFYRDPPEFQTVLKSDDNLGYHIGYFRDSPEMLPILLASNSPKKDGILTPMGGNIFSAINIFLEDLKKSGNPFKKMAITNIQTVLMKEPDIDFSKKTKAMIAREKKIVSRTFNKIGLCVPFDKKSQLGYRDLAQTNKELEENLTKLAKAKSAEEKDRCLTLLQPVFTYASIATDECDFGTGIELGWNIISHGVEQLNDTAKRFLVTNYKLLNMESFAKIAEAHMENRKQGFNLSIL